MRDTAREKSVEAGGSLPDAIAVTGYPEGIERIAKPLEDRGVRVVRWGTIGFEQPEEMEPLVRALDRIDSYDWVVFTSPRSVTAVASIRPAPPETCEVAAVGRETARGLEEEGWPVHLVGDGQGADSLARLWLFRYGPVARGEPMKILFPASSRASEGLDRILRAGGATVDRVTAYQTVERGVSAERMRADLEEGVRGVTFSSPSSVAAVAEALDDVTGLVAACIGPTTAAAAHRAGFPMVEVAAEANAESLVEAAVRALTGR